MDRRSLIKGIGLAILATKIPPFIPSLVESPKPLMYPGETLLSRSVHDQIQALWAPMFNKELTEPNYLIMLTNNA